MAAVAAEPITNTIRRDGYLPIEQYAAIGDGRTLALVGIDGAIDWMCLPELDGPSIFATLLDAERGGSFVLRPSVPYMATRLYVEQTNILETTFATAEGEVVVLDLLTIDKSQTAPWWELVRQVRCRGGTVPMQWHYEPRFEFGARTARFGRREDTFTTGDGALQLGLRCWDAGEPAVCPGALTGAFVSEEGTQSTLAMVATHQAPLIAPERGAIERRIVETAEVWRSWVSRHSYAGNWCEAVERSLLAIRLLADGRTGAIAAAGTTSLPEVLGGERNYDYRYGWARDLCFTLDALLAVGMEELTQASVTWLLDATRHTHPRIDPVYGLGGGVVRSQQKLDVPGYRRTRPAHLGNNAGSQLQLGGYGDFLETLATYVRQGHILGPATGARLADSGQLLERIWRNEDSGLWELGDSAHYGTSKLGCWVAFDRLLELVDEGQVPGRRVVHWRQARDEIRAFIERHLFSPEKRSYLMKAGSDALDCGMLLAARRGFCAEGEERLLGTIAAIGAELQAESGLFYRYSGMQDEENAFVACSFWMVEALAFTGQLDAASQLMASAVALANDVGLYSEEIETGTHAFRGNFPQALSHLALISAADALAQAAQS